MVNKAQQESVQGGGGWKVAYKEPTLGVFTSVVSASLGLDFAPQWFFLRVAISVLLFGLALVSSQTN